MWGHNNNLPCANAMVAFIRIDDVERSLITYLRIGGEANFARHVREAGMAKCKLFLISEITLQLN